MIDCHAHINSEDFEKDRDAVLRDAGSAGISAILDSGTNLKENKKVLELAKQFKILKPSLGWQPNQLDKKAASENLEFIKETTNQFVAIGEIGLDYWWIKEEAERKKETPIFKMYIELAKELDLPIGLDYWFRGSELPTANRKPQTEIFKMYIELAKELDLPIVTHSRSAGKYVIEILEKEKAERVCMHAFDGNFSSAQKGVELGYFFSIPPSIVRSEQKQSLVKNLPLENLLLESDSPVLGPDAKERNVPANLKIAAQKIAEIKKVDISEVIKITTKNAQRLFKL